MQLIEILEDQMTLRIPMVEELQRSEDSEPLDDNATCGRKGKRVGTGHQAKNLEAERKRRRKLNDKLYSLRALVPNISKLDRAAILDDAINYVEELHKQANDLQIELEQHSDSDDDDDDEAVSTAVRNAGIHNITIPVELHQNGGETTTVENAKEESQQMEPQVEVLQVEGDELFIKVLCEDKPSRQILRLMEAMASLDLQVINVNAVKCTCLVSIIFVVEKRDSEIKMADRVKETLMEVARGH